MKIINFQEAREKQEKEKKDRRELEERLKGNYRSEKPRIIYLHYYLHTRSGEYKGVLETPIFTSYLPHGKGWAVWGDHNPLTYSSTFGINLPFGDRDHTRRHERVHSKGGRDEAQTDRIAESPYYESYVA